MKYFEGDFAFREHEVTPGQVSRKRCYELEQFHYTNSICPVSFFDRAAVHVPELDSMDCSLRTKS
jgi:hypothetical protein